MAETILVIEDERLTRKNLVDFLMSEGFQTLEASNGRVGIELAQTHMPDLIICDILMPELDGYDVLITLQQQIETAAIPFIFLTVSATEDGFRQGLALGADDYLSKPVTSEQLRTAIAAQLKKAKPSLQAITEPFANTFSEETAFQKYATDTIPLSKVSAMSVSRPSQSVDGVKAKLLETLCPILKQRLINLRGTVEELPLAPDTPQKQKLRDEFVRFLSLVNEVTAIQKSLNPDNAMDLLEVFASMVQDIEKES